MAPSSTLPSTRAICSKSASYVGCMGSSARVRLAFAASAGSRPDPDRLGWLQSPASRGGYWPTESQGYVHGPLAMSPGGTGATADLLWGPETGADPLVGR